MTQQQIAERLEIDHATVSKVLAVQDGGAAVVHKPELPSLPEGEGPIPSCQSLSEAAQSNRSPVPSCKRFLRCAAWRRRQCWQCGAKATAEDVHRYQLRLASIGATVSTVNATASALRFFFTVTLKRSDLADEVVSVREPRRLPVVLSPEEVGQLLAATTNVKQKAALSLTYATGL